LWISLHVDYVLEINSLVSSYKENKSIETTINKGNTTITVIWKRKTHLILEKADFVDKSGC